MSAAHTTPPMPPANATPPLPAAHATRAEPRDGDTASARAQERFWRSVAEAEGRDDPGPTQPTGALPLTRRHFLGLAGASLALAGAGGCSRPPLEKIVPYHDGPAEQTYGKPVFYATGLDCAGEGVGVLVECNMGRPTKIEGNQAHPASRGATDVAMQAAVLELWDPDRSQQVRRGERPTTWGEAALALRERVMRLGSAQGAGLCLLTEGVGSPSLQAAIADVLRAFPRATWDRWQPQHRDNVHRGAALAYGRPLAPVYRFDRARTIVALDADFLGWMPGHVRYARDFALTRHAGATPDARSRLYVVECVPSLTGANADHRLPLRTGDVIAAARALAGALGVAATGGRTPERTRADAVPAAWLDSVVADLRASGSAALVLAGERQPPEVHALAHAINDRLGASGNTVLLLPAPDAGDMVASLGALASRMHAGDVDTLVILGANPVYNAPADVDFAAALARVPFSLHHGLYVDETAARCTFHVPAAHALESWGDVRAFDGTVTLQQPCIAPLYDGRTAHQVLAALQGDATSGARDLVARYWRTQLGDAFDATFDDALRRGVLPGSATAPVPPTRAAGTPAPSTPPPPAPTAPPAPDAQALDVVFVADPRVHDGRYANHPWLQELPKPLSQLTWDNAAEISPALAGELGVGNEDLVEVTVGERRVTAPVWIVPGMAERTVALTLGYGRTHAGTVGNGRGYDAYRLRTTQSQWVAGGAAVRRTGARYALACAQTHGRMEGRDIVRELGVAEAAACTAEACGTPGFRDARTLYDSPPMGPYAWAMSIDLSACIGCGTCTIACQAENNIPTVGKEEVRNGREMHWIRVDRYHIGPVGNPRTAFQPVPCMQCEHAPCEVVCPVEASVHDAQGLNVQVYNRCVGTRFCQNNCPYKVRRFNFFRYTDDVPQHEAQRNPEVTVRIRGVMEKCTYCLQRITTARIAADREGRRLVDGEVVTACQAACPTRAIAFGDLNDPASEVNRRKRSPLDYALLAELNTRPRTTYLARVVNIPAALGGTPPRGKGQA